MRVRSSIFIVKRANRFLDEYGEFYSTTLYSLLNIIKRESVSITGIISLPSKVLHKISLRSQRYYTNHNQHPPIPSRILTRLLSQINITMSDFNDHCEQVLELTGQLLADNKLGLSRSSQHRVLTDEGVTGNFCRHYRPVFSDLIRDTSISSYLQKCNIKSKTSLLRHLSEILFFSKISVLAYSGMRHAEAANLKYDCLESFYHGNKKHYLVNGGTTKLNHGIVKKVKWVVSTEAVTAIGLARKIVETVYKHLNSHVELEEPISNLLLFPSIGPLYKHNIVESLEPENMLYVTKPQALNSYIKTSIGSPIVSSLSTFIEEEDIRELEQIDCHRDWRSDEKFISGRLWIFTAHQFRRSLALYATNSGLVSLPSLRRQLQHITNEMSAYYSNGSSFAKNILGCDSDFVNEYRKTVPESEALSYIKNVLLSDEKLFGAHGAWLAINKEKNSNLFLHDRGETIKKFKNGQLQYQETIIGGCTGTSQCIERATRSLVACIECAGGIIVPSKLDNVINSQKTIVNSLPESSLLYRTEKDDLDKLLAVRERINIKNQGA